MMFGAQALIFFLEKPIHSSVLCLILKGVALRLLLLNYLLPNFQRVLVSHYARM